MLSCRIATATSSRRIIPSLSAMTSISSRNMSFRIVPDEPIDDSVIVERMPNVKILTLNKLQSLNALDMDMVKTLKDKIRIWNYPEDTRTKIIVVRSDSSKVFCAGGDVVTIAKATKDPTSTLPADFFFEEYQLNHLIATSEKPQVSLWNGITMGGGVGLTMHGMFRIATENTQFAMPETGIGFFPDVGGSYFLPRLDGYLGTYLGLTGKILKGGDAFWAGCATDYVPSHRLPHLIDRLDTQATYVTPHSVSRTIGEFAGEPGPFSLAENGLLGLIDYCFRHDTVEDILKELYTVKDQELRPAQREWVEETISSLHEKSPLSLKVTLRQIRYGASLSLANCLRMEYFMSQRFMVEKDFYEGIDSLLISKTAKSRREKSEPPFRWDPVSLSEITDSLVLSYFPLNKTGNIEFDMTQRPRGTTHFKQLRFLSPKENPAVPDQGLMSRRRVRQVIEELVDATGGGRNVHIGDLCVPLSKELNKPGSQYKLNIILDCLKEDPDFVIQVER